MPPQRKSYDAIVIGAGHNGLTAAAYLSRAGFSALVVERREIVGGCCVTEEIAPGCRASTTSYIASMLRPAIVRDLDLGAHGLRMVPCDPGLLVPFPDGHVVPWWADRERAIAEFEEAIKLNPSFAAASSADGGTSLAMALRRRSRWPALDTPMSFST